MTKTIVTGIKSKDRGNIDINLSGFLADIPSEIKLNADGAIHIDIYPDSIIVPVCIFREDLNRDSGAFER